jgi:FkbM family methyltransferase
VSEPVNPVDLVVRRGRSLAAQSIAQLANWREALAAFSDDLQGKAPEKPLVLRFLNGLELEMMPGGIGAYTILFPEIFCRRVYEPPEFSFTDAPIIVDLGANVGFFSCKMARQFPRGVIFAVDVMPQYCDLIRKNAARSKLCNINVIEAAIGDGKTDAEIPYWFTQTGYLKVTSTVPPGVRATAIKVPSTSLQRLFDEHDIVECDLLKVDIEGHEYAMFSAAMVADLRRCRQIALEWHATHAADGPRHIARTLERAGFSILPATTFEGDTGLLYATRNNTSSTAARIETNQP